MANTIQVAILAETANMRRGIDSANRQLEGFGRKAKSTGNVLKAALGLEIVRRGLSATVGFLKEATSAASDLQQSTGGVDAVFGKSAGGIKKSAKDAAQALGLSTNAYQELATTLGAGLKNQGIKDFAGQTKEVIGLGGDLAAQFGGSTKDAVQAISSLMRGEADPIERYGVGIKQSAVSAYLAAKGQDKLTGAAKTQAEAQARLALLFDQTKDAHGAFAREMDTDAGVAARNAATWENTKTALGTILLPAVTAVRKIIGEQVLPVIERLVGYLGTNLPTAITWVKAFLAGLKGDGTAATYLDTVRTNLGVLFTVLRDIAAAVAEQWPAIKEAITGTLAAVQTVGAAVAKFWSVWGPTISALVGNAFRTIVQLISGAMTVIAGVIKTVLALISGDWSGAWAGVKQIVAGVWKIIKALVQNGIGQARAVMGGVGGQIVAKARETWENVKRSVSDKLDQARAAVSSKINSVKATLASAWSYVTSKTRQTWTDLGNVIRDKINSVKDRIRQLPASIRAVFANAGDWLLSAGRRIISGLLSGITDRIGAVRTKLRELTNLIPDWKGPRDRDERLLTDAGRVIMESLVRGFDQGEGQVRSQLADLTSLIAGAVNPTVAPAVTLAGLAPLGGGVTQHITVEVKATPGTNLAELGRELTKALKAYQRAGGKVVTA